MDDKVHNPFELLIDRLKRIGNLLSNILSENQKQPLNQEAIGKGNTIELAFGITGLKKKTIYNLCKRLIPHSKRGKISN